MNRSTTIISQVIHAFALRRLRVHLPLLVSMSFAIPNAHSATLQFNFSGTFTSCVYCFSTPLAPLYGTSFSGSITIPTTGLDSAQGDPSLGRYSFGPDEASFTFNSALPEFDVFDGAPVSVLVNNCIGDTCAINGDYIFVDITQGAYIYELALSSVSGQMFDTDAIPSADILSQLNAGFEILSTDYSMWINDDYETAFTVTAIPVPLSSYLLGSGLIGLLGIANRSRKHHSQSFA